MPTPQQLDTSARPIDTVMDDEPAVAATNLLRFEAYQMTSQDFVKPIPTVKGFEANLPLLAFLTDATAALPEQTGTGAVQDGTQFEQVLDAQELARQALLSKYDKSVPGFREFFQARAIMQSTELTPEQKMLKAKPLFDLSVAKTDGDLPAYEKALATAKARGIDTTNFVIYPKSLDEIDQAIDRINLQELDLTIVAIGKQLINIEADYDKLKIESGAHPENAELKAKRQQQMDYLQKKFDLVSVDADVTVAKRLLPIGARWQAAIAMNALAKDLTDRAGNGDPEKVTLLIKANSYNAESKKMLLSLKERDKKMWDENPIYRGSVERCKNGTLIEAPQQGPLTTFCKMMQLTQDSQAKAPGEKR